MFDRPCPTCNGKQMIPTPDGGQWQICPRCDGDGRDPGIERYFAYLFQTLMLAAAAPLLNQRVVINGDAPFKIKMLTRTRQTGAPVSGVFRIRLFNNENQYYSSSGEGGTNDRVRDDCLFGDGSLPFIVVPHIIIPPSGSINFDLENTSAADNTIHMVFHGSKLYPSPRAA